MGDILTAALIGAGIGAVYAFLKSRTASWALLASILAFIACG